MINMEDVESRRQAMMDSLAEANKERIRNEEEKRLSLRKIAEHSEETVNSLRETNVILRENNQLLREKNEELGVKLAEINKVISDLAEASKDACENQEEVMRQALALAVQ